MRLYMPASASYARQTVTDGFVGARKMYKAGDDGEPDRTQPDEHNYCESGPGPPKAG